MMESTIAAVDAARAVAIDPREQGWLAGFIFALREFDGPQDWEWRGRWERARNIWPGTMIVRGPGRYERVTAVHRGPGARVSIAWEIGLLRCEHGNDFVPVHTPSHRSIDRSRPPRAPRAALRIPRENKAKSEATHRT